MDTRVEDALVNGGAPLTIDEPADLASRAAVTDGTDKGGWIVYSGKGSFDANKSAVVLAGDSDGSPAVIDRTPLARLVTSDLFKDAFELASGVKMDYSTLVGE